MILRRKLKARHLDEDSTATFPERRRALSRSINNLRIPQRLYMPGVAADLDAIDTTTLADRPEDVKLYIPSSLPPSARDAQCISELPHLEYRIRCAQAAHFLDAIRLFRRLIRAVTKKTRVHIYGTQRTTTRTHGLYDKATTKQARAVSGYRASRNAISALAPNEEFGSWKTIFLELKDSDIRGPGCEAEEPSASRFIQSWIWTTSPHITTSTEDSDLQATVRIEWCKAQARAKRFEEEVELVVEEMRRTLAYFEWKACEWERHATTPPLGCQAIDKTTAAGITSYAYKQANVQREMVKVFIDDWHELLKENALGSYWLDEWTTPSGNKRRCLPSNVRLFHSEPSTPRTGTPCAPELLPDDASSSITTSDDSRNE